jgi:hypothetical protein
MHLQLQDETGRDISMAIAASRFPTTVPTFLGFREIEQFSFAANLRGYGEIKGRCSNRMRQWLSLLRTPKRRESLEIFTPLRYRRGHDDDSFRPGFDARLPRS